MILKVFIFFSLTLFILPSVFGQFEDRRCKCFCPNANLLYPELNLTDRNLYIKIVGDRAECKCDSMVTGVPEEKKKEFCPKCECQFQTRNTTTIKIVNSLSVATLFSLILYLIWLKVLKFCIIRRPKNTGYDRHSDEIIDDVVVILVICVMGLLVVYLLFLLCLDPMLKQPRKDHPYERQSDEDNIFARSDAVSTASLDNVVLGDTRLRRASEGVLNKVEQQQNKWFAKVHEQRRKIFTDHTMLN